MTSLLSFDLAIPSQHSIFSLDKNTRRKMEILSIVGLIALGALFLGAAYLSYRKDWALWFLLFFGRVRRSFSHGAPGDSRVSPHHSLGSLCNSA
jgi:hypothetical protein